MDATFRALEVSGLGGDTVVEQAWGVESEAVVAILGDVGCNDLRAEVIVRHIQLPP